MSLPLRVALVGMAVLALAACGRGEAPSEPPAAETGPGAPAALAGYSHRFETDVSGYFVPISEVRAGDRRLVHLFLAHERAFRAWEDGDRAAGAVPVTFVFEDGSRVVPDAYSATDGAVRVSGRHPQLGGVSFEGTLDAGVLAESRRALGGDRAPVLTGALRIGGRTYENQGFSWWSGD